MRVLYALLGHLWTVIPTVIDRVRPATTPPGEPWSVAIPDPVAGTVTLTGTLHDPGAESLVVLIHGLGGTQDVRYVKTAASAVVARGHAALRLGLRGSDRGGDLFHGGMADDLLAALQSPTLGRFRRIYLLGFSMGGTLSLLACCEETLDSRVRAVAAVGSPLDMHVCQRHMDAPARLVYRRWVFKNMREVHAAAVRQGRLHGADADVSKVDRFRDWDARVVVPRFGFRDVDHYHEAISLTGRAGRIRVPALLLAARHDPMIPLEAVYTALKDGDSRLEVREIDVGGHVYVPRGAVEGVLDWLLAQA